MKSCNRCKHFNKLDKKCLEFKIGIIDHLTATYCKAYNEGQHNKTFTHKNIQCCNCRHLNKYGWCYERSKLFNEDEKYKTRQCMKYKVRTKQRYY